MTTRGSLGQIGAVAILLVACAGGTVREDGRTIQVEMRSFSFTPSVLWLTAGEKVTLILKNPDNVEHEFMAGLEPTADGGYKRDLLAGVDIAPKQVADHGMGHGGAVAVRVAAGGIATLRFVVPSEPGSYEFGCFVAGHYGAGMRGQLTIESATSPTTAPTGKAVPAATTRPTPTPAHTMGGDMEGEAH